MSPVDTSFDDRRERRLELAAPYTKLASGSYKTITLATALAAPYTNLTKYTYTGQGTLTDRECNSCALVQMTQEDMARGNTGTHHHYPEALRHSLSSLL